MHVLYVRSHARIDAFTFDVAWIFGFIAESLVVLQSSVVQSSDHVTTIFLHLNTYPHNVRAYTHNLFNWNFTFRFYARAYQDPRLLLDYNAHFLLIAYTHYVYVQVCGLRMCVYVRSVPNPKRMQSVWINMNLRLAMNLMIAGYYIACHTPAIYVNCDYDRTNSFRKPPRRETRNENAFGSIRSGNWYPWNCDPFVVNRILWPMSIKWKSMHYRVNQLWHRWGE